MELYIHIPFCVKKCNYCDFLSFPGFGCDADERHRSLICNYMDALRKEIEDLEKLFKVKGLTSVFIGGGTPSVLDITQTMKLLGKVNKYIRSNDETEYTIECNPGTVTKEKLLLYRKFGVNRLSFGLQSADNEILKKLGRIHTYEEFTESFRLARECGFKNINIDLISAVPGQTVENWTDTLLKAVKLEPEHISAYSLILEEGTPLYEEYKKNPDALRLPDEDEERKIYHLTERYLKENGYERYEISNYSKPGFECRHNIGYWTGEEYVGAGLGASSYLSKDGCEMLRLKNTEDIEKYISYYKTEREKDVRKTEEVLDREAQMAEFCILGLRMCKGVSFTRFKDSFGIGLRERFENIIDKYIGAGLLEISGDYLCFTEKGLDLSNTVLCEFL